MMKILCVLFILISFSGFSQQAEYIKGKKYRGYIFPKNHNAFIGVQNQKSRFSPEKIDVEYFESRLCNRIKELTKDIPDQGENCPNIRKKLRKYLRQYFGFINTDNERIFYVNFVWSKDDKVILDKIDKTDIQVHGGCSYYWQIKYNVEKDVFYDLSVNTKD